MDHRQRVEPPCWSPSEPAGGSSLGSRGTHEGGCGIAKAPTIRIGGRDSTELKRFSSRIHGYVVRFHDPASFLTLLSLQPDHTDAQTYLEAAAKALREPDVAAGPISDRTSTKTAAVPTSFATGRYVVKDFLGEGGKKRVCLAHDSVLDRDVALAVIKTEGLDETSRARITREARAMGRLGDHPHALSIRDLGDEAGQPYMVLPLMSGGDIEALLEAEDHKLPLAQAIDLAAQICRGLEFAHSNGIAHRDLKPGNV